MALTPGMVLQVQQLVTQGVTEHWTQNNIDQRLIDAEEALKQMFNKAEETLKEYANIAEQTKIEIQNKFTENENQAKELREFINKSNIANQGYTDNFRDMTAAEPERIRKSQPNNFNRLEQSNSKFLN